MITEAASGSTETETGAGGGGEGGGVLLTAGGRVLFPPPQAIEKMHKTIKTQAPARFLFLIFNSPKGKAA